MIHHVNIEKIITGGFGLARLENGLIVLVPYVLPGETVLVRETAQHRGYLEALPVEIVAASPDRISPPCPYFTLCGGCDFQHINSSCQHSVKTEIIKESLKRANVVAEKTAFEAIIPSPQPYQYRFRIRLKVGQEGQIGFYQFGSNDLVPITRCLLATDRINQTLQELNASGLFKKFAPDLSEIELMQSPSDNLIFVILHPYRNTNIAKSQFETFAESLNTVNNILIKKGGKLQTLSGKASSFILRQDFDNSICGRPFALSWSPGCFSQVNAQQNQGLIALVCRQYMKVGGQKVLDLYCGMGNFSVPVGFGGAEVTGVEQNPESIRWAQFNANKSGLDQCRFLVSDVGRYLHTRQKATARFDAVLVDPPRQGLGKYIHPLTRLEPQSILYISCDPATLARDLAAMTKKGYNLTSLTPVDMFPQTHHIESVVLLEKN
ncbi:MAG: 23S rRNA (uracil(1939)-C(5))-methyltransferase RlmD [Desulfobulbaceae bacterium]|nr:23S rRNA (uracil(1939)-C(5))-methyltransferase RlmD [Desulfobulbaceae bacterium]